MQKQNKIRLLLETKNQQDTQVCKNTRTCSQLWLLKCPHIQ